MKKRNGNNNEIMNKKKGEGMNYEIDKELKTELEKGNRAGDVLTGVDDGCGSWIKAYREPTADGSDIRDGRRRRKRAKQ